jgi:hypothetical protein
MLQKWPQNGHKMGKLANTSWVLGDIEVFANDENFPKGDF